MIGRTNTSGQSLPKLITPASTLQILSGYQAIDQNGEVLTGTIASLGAQTIIPSTSNQTIAAGQYLNGAQTIQGDSNLIASNIKSGVSIFGVQGTSSSQEYVDIRYTNFSGSRNIHYVNSSGYQVRQLYGTGTLYSVLKNSLIMLERMYDINLEGGLVLKYEDDEINHDSWGLAFVAGAGSLTFG